jgi:hypothetical protein
VEPPKRRKRKIKKRSRKGTSSLNLMTSSRKALAMSSSQMTSSHFRLQVSLIAQTSLKLKS